MKSPSGAPVWAELSARALLQNYSRLRRLAAPASLIPVVKADGYGLGADWVRRSLRLKSLAVMTVSEGGELRASGFRGRILLLSPCDGAGLRRAVQERLVPSVSDFSQLRDLDREASRQGRRVELEFEVNSGMNRLGCEPWELPSLVSALGRTRRLACRGAWTHFGRADREDDDTKRAAELFRTALRLAGLGGTAAHAAASSALVRQGSMEFSHARPGLALYGADPVPADRKLFKPVLSLRARVLQIRRVGKGSWVSYGRSWKAKRGSLLAVLGLGYADGWRRVLTNRAQAILRGRRVPLVGTVCMDMVMADATMVPGLRAGGTATLIGKDGGETILLEEVSKLAGTIPYEILTGLGRRVPRLVGA